MRSPHNTALVFPRRCSAIAPAVLWLVVLSLSLLGPLACILHCVELQRADGAAPTRALFTCQLFAASLPAPGDPASSGERAPAPILPDSPFSLLRAYYVLCLAHQAAVVAPLLAVAFVGLRHILPALRAADAPPTPPPRLAS